MGTVIQKTSNGPIKTVLEINGPALRLFSQRDQNIMVRTAMQRAAELFIAVFLPKRFTAYARTFLGYTASAKYEKRKKRLAEKGVVSAPQPTPLVYTGASRQGALAGAKASAMATLKKAVGIVRFPRGAINFKKSPVLQTIPAHEVTRMAEEVARCLPEFIASGVVNKRAGGAQRTIVGATSRVVSVGQRRAVR